MRMHDALHSTAKSIMPFNRSGMCVQGCMTEEDAHISMGGWRGAGMPQLIQTCAMVAQTYAKACCARRCATIM